MGLAVKTHLKNRVGVRVARGAAFAAVWGLALLGAACSPTLDWRELRLDGPGLLAMFPCRPITQSRQLSLAGAAVTMQLQACEAGGHTYAVGLADMHDPAAVGPALVALRAASEGNLGGAAGVPGGHRPSVDEVRGGAGAASDPAWSVSGATPQAVAGRWQLAGQRPDGAALRMDTAVFARGTWVVQATVLGSAVQPAATAPFFEGLRVVP